MRMRMMLVPCTALALTVGVTTATAGGGSSGDAKLCKNGGWQHWVRSDGTSFKNQGDCVSYVVQGGTLRSPSTCTKTSYGDFLTTGAVNTSPNGEFYNSKDGTCSLAQRVEGTLVQASSNSGANAICAPLVAGRGLSYSGVVPAGGDFTSDYWFCVYQV